jgi:hypothetical protein
MEVTWGAGQTRKQQWYSNRGTVLSVRFVKGCCKQGTNIEYMKSVQLRVVSTEAEESPVLIGDTKKRLVETVRD